MSLLSLPTANLYFFKTELPGIALLNLTASTLESTETFSKKNLAVVITILLDRKYNQDIVLFKGQKQFTYQVSLGSVNSGKHTVEAIFAPKKSSIEARGAKIKNFVVNVIPDRSPQALIYQYSPILYGRNLSKVSGTYENNYTDIPLLMYHTINKEPDGNTTIKYTVIWSNEDGGTSTPALMAQWGRTTDIEWIYQVTLDPLGNIVSEAYHGFAHLPLPFIGSKEGKHPLLVTATINNVMMPVIVANYSTGYRFFLDPSPTLPQNRSREAIMDVNPWIYSVMVRELFKEGKIEAIANPNTPEVSDPRNYLYLEIDKTTMQSQGLWENRVGVALAVKLKKDSQWYASHHHIPEWSIQRDRSAATTVELPLGTTRDDIEAIKAIAIPLGWTVSNPYKIALTKINRAFFLDNNYLPQQSFIDWRGEIILTSEHPEAIVIKAYP
ncbi:MAG: hypothetical protein HC763_12165 [Hydrococcus sp. CRU_1_1]|nr:hypothetical protein [Hydrococcus sp. CRU_1_1]